MINRFRYKRAAERLKERALAQAIGEIAQDQQALHQRIADLEAHLERVGNEVSGVRQLVGPFVATYPDGSMLCQTLHGIKFFVDPEDLIITPQMIVYRQWEAELTRRFAHICTPDTVFVDVGANIGYFSCLAASYIGTSGRGQVHAFEPNARLFALLRRNAEINWSLAPIALHQCAVADFAGTASLQIPEGHAANATLSAYKGELDFRSDEVEVIRLDDVLPPDLAVDLLKIDVEGHELGVLRGARAVIARSPAIRIVIEWSIAQIRDAGVDPRAYLEPLAGFRCYNADLPGDILGEKHDPEWLLDQTYMNVLLQRE